VAQVFSYPEAEVKKKLAEIICHTKKICNFAIDCYGNFCLYFIVFSHYEVTAGFAKSLIIDN